ncbi:MAG: radical SAM protein [Ruminococcaceae bacterium]|nr:radical SAM protein [Oscillospiraceae bacterium]
MKTFNIPIFVPHKGCPHDCIFCNQKRITGQILDITAQDVINTIEENLASINSIEGKKYIEIAFFGGSFTAIEKSLRQSLCKIAHTYLKEGRINGIRCSTRPDCIDDEILKELKEYGFTAIELGVQSTDDEVLLKSGRGHNSKATFYASKLIKEYGFSLGLQMMIGLLGDTYEKSIKTAKDIISLKPDCVRVYPTLVIKDTHLYDMMQNGTYTPITLDYTVKILAEILDMFYKEKINVIRVGLQTTDEVNEKTVTGPYHPAIRELAEGEIFKNKIEKFILENNLKNTKIIIFASSRNISKISGQNKKNSRYFYQKYKIKTKYVTDNTLTGLNLKIQKAD